MVVRITLQNVTGVLAHLENISRNVKVGVNRMLRKTAKKAIKHLRDELRKRARWSHSHKSISSSFYVAKIAKGLYGVGSTHPAAIIANKGVKKRWKQPNNPIWQGRLHPPNRPLNYIRPAFKKAVADMRRLTRTEFKLSKMR